MRNGAEAIIGTRLSFSHGVRESGGFLARRGSPVRFLRGIAATQVELGGSGGLGFRGDLRNRLAFVVGDDTADRRQNLLHRGLLNLCRLRHLQLHIFTVAILRAAGIV